MGSNRNLWPIEQPPLAGVQGLQLQPWGPRSGRPQRTSAGLALHTSVSASASTSSRLSLPACAATHRRLPSSSLTCWLPGRTGLRIDTRSDPDSTQGSVRIDGHSRERACDRSKNRRGPMAAERRDEPRAGALCHMIDPQSEYRRYAEVARKLAKQQQGSNGFMWAQLAALWDKVADRMAAKERSCLRRAASGKRVSRFGRESATVGGEAVN